MSFWKSLFGGGSAAARQRPAIRSNTTASSSVSAPFKEGANYQTAGTIEKEIDGVRKEHRFIRADSHPGYDDAVSFTIAKARQMIDQMGERLFN